MVTFIVHDDPVLILRDSLVTIIHKLVNTSLNSRCQEHMHAMTLKISVSQSLPSRYNRAFGFFLSAICIVCSSTLPLLAKPALWVSTQSFFLYPTIVANLCYLKLDERNTIFR